MLPKSPWCHLPQPLRLPHPTANSRTADLTLNESIFLASLIPRPKQFRSFFNSDGSLRGNAGYFQMIAHRLFRTGIITEEEAMTASPSAVLKGKAQFDIIRDTIPTDSVIIEPITNVEDIAQ